MALQRSSTTSNDSSMPDTAHSYVGRLPMESISLSAASTSLTETSLEPVLSLRPELLRAVELGTVLHQCGIALKTSKPDPKTHKNFWDLSKPVQEIDCFLSHSWITHGWQKYVVLSIRANGACGAIAGFLTILILCICKLLKFYPSPSHYEVMVFEDWKGEVPMNYPLCLICGPAVVLFTIFIRNELPRRMRSQTMTFLDVVCINQRDKKMMKEGIYGLGAFMKNTNELLILWTAPYFSRLWCVYEVAAFHALHGGEVLVNRGSSTSVASDLSEMSTSFLYRMRSFATGSGSAKSVEADGKATLSFCPLFLVLTGLATFLVIWLLMAVVALVNRTNIAFYEHISGVYLLAGCLALIGLSCGVFPVHFLRKLVRQKTELFDQIQRFDIAKAGCREQDDRKYIMAAVLKWFRGHEAFNRYVQEHLSCCLVSDGEADWTFSHSVQVSFPAICYWADVVSGFGMVDAMPLQVKASVIIALTGILWLEIPIVVTLFDDLLERYAEQQPSRLEDWFVTLGVSLVTVLVTMILTWCGFVACRQHIAVSICYFCSLLVLLFVHSILRTSQSKRVSQQVRATVGGRFTEIDSDSMSEQIYAMDTE